MEQLAFDLLLHIREPGTCAVLVRIEERIDESSMPSIEDGVLRCLVEEVIHGKLAVASHVTIRFSRMKDLAARAKAGVNHWNLLPLQVGDRLLVVGKANGNGKLDALSGNQVASSTDAVVTGLRECYRIQAIEKGSNEHKRALRTGLVAANPLTCRYALEAISRHEDVSREDGCAMIVEAIEKDKPDRDLLLRFADVLSSIPYFDEDKHADDVNRLVIVNIVEIINRLSKPEDQVTCVRYLASCVLAEFDPDPVVDAKVRSTLLKAIQPSPAKSVSEVLASMIRSPTGDDRSIAEDLTQAWSQAR